MGRASNVHGPAENHCGPVQAVLFMSVALPLCHPCYGPDLDLDLLRSPAIPSLSVPCSLPAQTIPQVHLSMACALP